MRTRHDGSALPSMRRIQDKLRAQYLLHTLHQRYAVFLCRGACGPCLHPCSEHTHNWLCTSRVAQSRTHHRTLCTSSMACCARVLCWGSTCTNRQDGRAPVTVQCLGCSFCAMCFCLSGMHACMFQGRRQAMRPACVVLVFVGRWYFDTGAAGSCMCWGGGSCAMPAGWWAAASVGVWTFGVLVHARMHVP
jgi:hypothetical protein